MAAQLEVVADFALCSRRPRAMATGMRKLGYKQAVGVRTAVAIALGRRLHKAKSATPSNWAAISLSEGQVQYAGEDAFAALAVFYALGLGDRPRS